MVLLEEGGWLDERSWMTLEAAVAIAEIKGPFGEQIQDFRDKTSEKYEFIVHHEGIFSFCFTNKSPYHQDVTLMYKLVIWDTMTSMPKRSVFHLCWSRYQSWRKLSTTFSLSSIG